MSFLITLLAELKMYKIQSLVVFTFSKAWEYCEMLEFMQVIILIFFQSIVVECNLKEYCVFCFAIYSHLIDSLSCFLFLSLSQWVSICLKLPKCIFKTCLFNPFFTHWLIKFYLRILHKIQLKISKHLMLFAFYFLLYTFYFKSLRKNKFSLVKMFTLVASLW